MSVGGREITYRFAAYEIVDQLALVHNHHGTRSNALVVVGVITQQRLAGEGRNSRVVDERKELRQYPRFITRRVVAGCARRNARLRLHGLDITSHDRTDYIACGVRLEQYRPTKFIFDERR